ncbi:MAG: BREX-1 system phosphatase PglZ type A, partial [Niameybacter sp.]
MATLDLKQIIDKLNSEFVGDSRKLVFWFDENAEFNEDIEQVVLTNAKVYRLENNNFFFTKYFLEKEDTTTNYLIYAPFPKPAIRENHLADTIRYSKEFFADRASLLAIDLGIQEKYKPFIQKYIKFFGAKDRLQKFYDLEQENYTQDTIEIGIMCVLCKIKTVSFDEVVRVTLTEGTLEDNKFLAEFEKYDLMAAFWRLCEATYGYGDATPNLEKFVMTLFVTYISKSVDTDVPKGWTAYVSYKSGNIKHFLGNLMNSILYGEQYNALANQVCDMIQAHKYLAQMGVEAVVECDAFKSIDRMIITWMKERLLSEDTGATLGGQKIDALCEERLKKHYGAQFKEAYTLIKSAYKLMAALPYFPQSNLNEVITYYRSTGCLIDGVYRAFYRAFDRLEEPRFFEDIRELVENIYTNSYLEKITIAWNKALQDANMQTNIPLQFDFYKNYVAKNKERTVVIISDALRYEVGRELFLKLENDVKCTAKLEPMMSVLPSYTKLGMAALLPHKTIEMKEVGKVVVDDRPSDSSEQRQAILQSYVPNSKCVQFKDIFNMNQEELRAVFQEQSVVYVYHNQIDARGDKQISEHEVFNACEEVVEEIYR